MHRQQYESQLERKHREIAVNAGWFCDKIMRTSLNSFPDRFYARQGRIVLIEWKRPGQPVSKQQALRHDQLRAAGVEVYVVRSVEEANEILKLRDDQLQFDL